MRKLVIYAKWRSKGDEALFGGHTTLGMKKKLKIPLKRPIADFLPTITIKAKDLAAELTNFNSKKNNLRNEAVITGEHEKKGIHNGNTHLTFFPEVVYLS